jgi:DNA polymerase-3 subunit gamma/tau
MLSGKREIDAKEILNTPFVQRATELFDPQKIQIRQKV